MEKALMTIKTVAEYLDMGVAQIYKIRSKDHNFPVAIVFSQADSLQTKKYYLKSDIDRWLEGLSKAQEKAN